MGCVLSIWYAAFFPSNMSLTHYLAAASQVPSGDAVGQRENAGEVSAEAVDNSYGDNLPPESEPAATDIGEESFMSIDQGMYIFLTDRRLFLIGSPTWATGESSEAAMPAILATLSKISSETIPGCWIVHVCIFPFLLTLTT